MAKEMKPDDDPEILKLREEWPTLNKYQKGERITPLLRRYSVRELEALLPASAKRIRDFKELAEISWRHRPKTRVVGTKKLLQEKRKLNEAKRMWQKVMAGDSGPKLQKKLEKTMKEWMMREIAPCYWDKFLHELLRPVTGVFDLLERNNPEWTEIQLLGNWEKIIEDTRPKDIPDHFEFLDVWFVRWLLRCMPVGEARVKAMLTVKQELRVEAARFCSESGHYWGPELWYADWSVAVVSIKVRVTSNDLCQS